jgi:hypothetical protein
LVTILRLPSTRQNTGIHTLELGGCGDSSWNGDLILKFIAEMPAIARSSSTSIQHQSVAGN